MINTALLSPIESEVRRNWTNHIKNILIELRD